MKKITAAIVILTLSAGVAVAQTSAPGGGAAPGNTGDTSVNAAANAKPANAASANASGSGTSTSGGKDDNGDGGRDKMPDSSKSVMPLSKQNEIKQK